MSEEEPGPTEGLMERAAHVAESNGFEAAVMVVFDTAYVAGREAGVKAGRARTIAALRMEAARLMSAGVDPPVWDLFWVARKFEQGEL